MTKRWAVGNVKALSDHNYQKEINSRLDLVDDILICFSLLPDPKQATGQSAVEWHEERNRIATASGAMSEESMSALKNFFPAGIDVACSFKELAVAKAVFLKMMQGGFQDIYLYQNGKLVQQYD